MVLFVANIIFRLHELLQLGLDLRSFAAAVEHAHSEEESWGVRHMGES